MNSVHVRVSRCTDTSILSPPQPVPPRRFAAEFRFAKACRAALDKSEDPPDPEKYAPRDGLGPGMRDTDRPLRLSDYLAPETYALFAKKEMDFITMKYAQPTGGGLKGGAPAGGAPATNSGCANFIASQPDPSTIQDLVVIEAPACFICYKPPAAELADGPTKSYQDTKKDFFLSTWQNCMRVEFRLQDTDMVVCPYSRLLTHGQTSQICQPGSDCVKWFIHGQTMQPRSVYPSDGQCIQFLEYYVWNFGRFPDVVGKYLQPGLKKSLPTRAMPGGGARARNSKKKGRGRGRGRGGRGRGRGRS